MDVRVALERWSYEADRIGCPVAARLLRQAPALIDDQTLADLGRSWDVEVKCGDRDVILIARHGVDDVTEILLTSGA